MKIAKKILLMLLILAFAFSLFACVCAEEDHVDEDGDSKCDVCGVKMRIEPVCEHTDEDKDLKCDKCEAEIEPCEHADANADAKCDKCGEAVALPPCVHADTNTDGKCDLCGANLGTLAVCEHADANADAKCDKCGEAVEPPAPCEHADTNTDGKCDLCGDAFTPAPCQHVNEDADGKCDLCGETINHTHNDGDKNGKCDVCSKNMPKKEEVIEYPWADDAPVKLVFRMTNHTNGLQNPSGCERYLAGEDINAIEDIDDMIADRNAEAEILTNVALMYEYYNDTTDYGWGYAADVICAESNSTTNRIPDIYCNFTHDLVCASLKGVFANLKKTDAENGNYFEFIYDDYDEAVDNRGYMYDYMRSTTLSLDKVYVLASDYFIDLIRSFYIVPVNIKLLESVSNPELAVDRTDDGEFTIDDFYEEVKEKKWTYNKAAAYSADVYKNTGTANSGEDIEDVLGFAISFGELSASGFIYTTDISIINWEWDNLRGDYDYEYPSESPQLYELFDNLSTLVNSKGVALIKPGTDVYKYGTNSRDAIRNRFCDNKVLFGDIILLGSLEYEAYQNLKCLTGFGIAPVPLYHEVAPGSDETYLTSIHNSARPGAISAKTKHFSECTAFLNYQSTHSKNIISEYYDLNLCYGITDGTAGTVQMLQYIRSHVRSSFDKNFEDAVGVFGKKEHDNWYHILLINNFAYDIRSDYPAKVGAKNEQLETLYDKYKNLPK